MTTRKIDLTLDVMRQCDAWPKAGVDYQAIIGAALSVAGFTGACEVSLVLADDAFVQALNRKHRGKDAPTNILSFPQDEPFLLGDLVLAYETVQRESEAQNKVFQDHFIHLLVHGTLHLLGYDHIKEKDAEEMEALEVSILKDMRIKNPYESA
jgi:probable rRNA maturation factor